MVYRFIDAEGAKAAQGHFKLSDQASTYFESNDKSIPSSERVEINGSEIPVLFPSDSKGDLIASSFYFLSAYHEYIQYKGQSRTAASQTGPGYFGVTRTPVVNFYFELLAQRMSVAGIKVEKKHKRPALCLSHDIDRMNSGWIEGGLNAIKKLQFGKAIKGLLHRLRGRDPWMNLDEIADEEARFNRTSTHFMLCRKSADNADYDVRAPRVQALVSELRQHGSEVGVHGSTGTHAAIPNLISDIEAVGGEISSNRFHFLHFDILNTPNVLEEAGIVADSSLGFFDEIGFRTGFTYPHYLFNFEKREMTSVMELPLNAMDTTFRKQSYLGTTIGDVPKLIDEMMATFEVHGGVFSLLWHNNYFSEYKFGPWKSLYSEILKLADGRFENSGVTDAVTKYANLK